METLVYFKHAFDPLHQPGRLIVSPHLVHFRGFQTLFTPYTLNIEALAVADICGQVASGR
ncbi:hypothetical protein BJV82DRAFT_584983 [Fennellomyces sp. T-0311]|nr:hypothetical protein BJV82DRAFT_584983 [Fennellomyces sp. T-0311]